ncbi:MAG: hydantoinase B/oxoprolinase family protein [Chromatiales bacterium]|nr:hydantoinase B/oxoprolinase family protein [Chromatiales bacterium]
MDSSKKWQFWIDRGGTFTDLVARTPGGELQTLKLLSSDPEHYADAALEGIRRCLGVAADQPIPHAQIDAVKMGTTVATNALLERQGEPTALIITAGFRDALRIGYQNRPDLFARHIELPELLYDRVIEAEERVDAAGKPLRPLDQTALRIALEQAYDQGLRSVAIVFMHAYRYAAHEQQAARLATQVGFTQVSTSHDVIPLIRLVGRGDTTVADAYLSPLLLRYIQGLRQELGDTRLMFMQSSGGLTSADFFRGRDSILSGPAGGVVGMVRTAEIAGIEQLIGFDMGGTSTDVSLFDGDFERAQDNLIAGVRIRAPMMKIHTVAAGGGSVLHYSDGRMQVGPMSAGANPGPACYRRGGPLTVTDINVLLGRIQPEHFPKVFGPGGDQPLDSDAVKNGFARLTDRINAEAGTRYSSEQAAEGFLRIAVNRMATAIKEISIQRGYDASRFALSCFGGAGGQHACQVADALGIPKIFIHPLAGVLSAYGMGLAQLRSIRQQSLELPLDEAAIQTITETAGTLNRRAGQELERQGLAAEQLSFSRRVRLRYAGTDSTLAVELDSLENMRENFELIQQQRFGFTSPDTPLVVADVEVEAIGETGAGAEQPMEPGNGAPQAVSVTPMWLDGQWQDTPVYQRANLHPGIQINGPAIITESHGTIVIEPGWQASMNAYGHLVLVRQKPASMALSEGTRVDPMLLEVFNNLFMHIAEQMGVILENTAHSVNIKERLDFSCAVFGPGGELVANAPHMPVHLGSMGESVRAIIHAHGKKLKAGDVYMLNAPYNGGTHLPDITLVSPVFTDEQLEFFVASRGHHADIGGITPGSMPPHSQSVQEEGILFDGFPLVSGGRFREQEVRERLAQGPYPARNPDQNIADLKAQIAANQKGISELHKMCEQFGLPVVRAYVGHVQDNAEAAVREVIGVLRDGRFRYEMDSGLVIQVAVTVDAQAGSACVDFTGTSPQSTDNFNAPSAICKAAVLYVFRCLVDRDIPMNAGCLKPIKIIIPPGSLLDPKTPAAVVAGNVETSQCITNALFGALGVMAAAQGTMNNLSFGNERYQYYETLCGGTGAGETFDGTSAVHSHMTNSRLTDPEVLELRFPVRLENFRIRENSGGSGRHHGGNGVTREIRFLEPMQVSMLSGHRRVAPFGLQGGQAGKTGRNTRIRASGERQELPGCTSMRFEAGDILRIDTPGGGGFGKP